MKPVLAKRHAADLGTTSLSRVRPQIQSLIDASRHHVVSTANLTLVSISWNARRVVTEDLQQNQNRAGCCWIALYNSELNEQSGAGFVMANSASYARVSEMNELLPAGRHF